MKNDVIISPKWQICRKGRNPLNGRNDKKGLYISRFLNVIYVCVFYSREGQSPSPSPIKERRQDIARDLGSAFTKIKKKVVAT